MTADVATPKSMESRTAMSQAAAPPDGHTEGAPTPFYDNLMSMIDATAQEKMPVVWSDGDAIPPGHRWSIPYPIACAAGFVVALAAGGAIMMATQVSKTEPPAVAAAPEAGSRVVASAATADEPVERPLPAAGPDGQGPTGVEGTQTGNGGIVTGTVLAEKSSDPAMDSPAAGQAIERLDPGPGMETPPADPPDVRAATEPTPTDPGAAAAEPKREPAMPAVASWAPALAPAIETGPKANQAGAPATGHIARIVSGVNMRAGPSNSQAVVATIPKGSRVEVIDCRAWCEVIFTGQRGWVYKSFIDPTPAPGSR
jgi:hypothetical protein